MKFNEFGDDWIIYPVEGYGNPDIVRSVIRTFKPDMLWFMTDPRFYYWLWQIENEIRPLVPMIYYHVWDNFPYPKFNKVLYQSTDVVATISKLTHSIVNVISPQTEEFYIPHAVNTDIFKRLPEEMINNFKRDNFLHEKNKMVFFWNNRNARRKQSGTVIWWFKEFLDIVGRDKACMIMHTEAKDENGQDLEVIIRDLKLDEVRGVRISQQKMPPEHLAALYNAADCTINISDAEGFGLATFESMACETPVIVNMTGGLQEQVTDLTSINVSEEYMLDRNIKHKGITVYENGVGVEPSSKAIIGSQQVPYIYEDRVNKDDFINALKTIYEMPIELRREMGKKGREHVVKNYNFPDFLKKWDELLMSVYERYGSWETRRNYKTWEMRNI